MKIALTVNIADEVTLVAHHLVITMIYRVIRIFTGFDHRVTGKTLARTKLPVPVFFFLLPSSKMLL